MENRNKIVLFCELFFLNEDAPQAKSSCLLQTESYDDITLRMNK